MCHCKTSTSECHEDFWSKNVFLILACDKTISFSDSVFLPRLLRRAVLDQPTVDSGGVTRGRSVAVAVDCCLFALQCHFNGTSTALPQHFHGTSTVSSLLSATVKRFSVSCLQDSFFFIGFPCCVLVQSKALQSLTVLT